MRYNKIIRYHRRNLIAHKVRNYAYGLLTIVVMVSLYCNPYRPAVVQHLSAMAGNCINKSSQWIGDNPRDIINYVMPIMIWSSQDIKLKSPPETALSALGIMTRINIVRPENILASQMPLLATANSNPKLEIPDTPMAAIEPKPLPAEEPAMTKPDGPAAVAIYCTHTGETYSLTDGVERLNGKQGGVVKVAAALKKSLEQEHKIKVVMTDKIHDTVYNDSYIESEKTVQALVKEHPELKMVLDIHRDAGRAREDAFKEINGEKVARIMIVVGSDARMPFPNWQQNLALAREITAKMDQLYPGLSLGIRVKEGRYNQQYHTGALLMEIGTVENSTEESEKAAKLLAEVLATVVLK